MLYVMLQVRPSVSGSCYGGNVLEAHPRCTRCQDPLALQGRITSRWVPDHVFLVSPVRLVSTVHNAL